MFNNRTNFCKLITWLRKTNDRPDPWFS